jgi:hypothetical protein
VREPGRIARNYLCSWFALDVVSVAVCAFDFLALCDGADCDPIGAAAPEEASTIDNLRVLRVLRALRLIKLLRLLRSSRMLERWETRLAINYAALEMNKALLQTFFVSHLFACIWRLQVIFAPSMDVTWLVDDGYCVVPSADEPYDATLFTDGEPGLACVGHYKVYCASLYFAVMTITSIGYGDIAATPLNTVEQNFTTFLMLAGSFLWAKVVAVFVVASDRDPEERDFHSNLDSLNRFMAAELFPSDLKRRLREYFMHTKHLRATKRDHELVKMMSEPLQGEVSLRINEKWLSRISFLRDASREFLVELSLHLRPHVYAPNELCPLGSLYIVHKGLALYEGRILGAGRVWGEDTILASAHLRSRNQAQALTFLDVLAIDLRELEHVTAGFPDRVRAMRRAAVRLATRRAFVIKARMARLEEGFKPGSMYALLDKTTPTWDRLLKPAAGTDNGGATAHAAAAQAAAAQAAAAQASLRADAAAAPAGPATSMAAASPTATKTPSGFLALSADGSGADLNSALRQVHSTIEALGEDNRRVQQSVQRLGSEEHAHSATLLHMAEEMGALRATVDRLVSALDPASGTVSGRGAPSQRSVSARTLSRQISGKI